MEPINIEALTRTEKSALIYAETCLVDYDGDVFLHYSDGGNSWVDGPQHTTTDVSWTPSYG